MRAATDRLSAAAGRDRPELPDRGPGRGRPRPLAADRRLSADRPRRRGRRWRGRSARSASRAAPAADRRPVGRPVPARPVRPPAGPGLPDHPARRAVRGRRRPHHRRSARDRPRLARRGADGDRRAARSRAVRAHFPETLLLAREVVAWGPTERVLHPDHCCAPGACPTPWPRSRAAPAERHERVRSAARALRRLRVHAPGAGRLPGAGHGLRPGRHHPVAAPHEPDGRRALARRPAGRRGRLSGRRPVAHRDEPRRLRRRPRRGAARGAGHPADAAARGRELRRLLPDLAGARRADRLAEGQQRRSDQRPVRLGAGGRRPGAAARRGAHQRDPGRSR